MNIINATYFVHDYHVALSVPDPGLNYTEEELGCKSVMIWTRYKISISLTFDSNVEASN